MNRRVALAAAAVAVIALFPRGSAQEQPRTPVLEFERIPVKLPPPTLGAAAFGARTQAEARALVEAEGIVRAAVPGGWLVIGPGNSGSAFVPDPEHTWDGGTVR